MKADTLKQTAYHEAGHMAAAVWLNFPHVPAMSIRPDGESSGRCEIRWPADRTPTAEDCLNFVKILFCGYLAEKYADGAAFDWVCEIMRAEEQSPTEPGDLRSVVEVAKILELTREALFGLYEEAEKLVDDPAFALAVGRLAEALLTRFELDFAAAKSIVESSRSA